MNETSFSSASAGLSVNDATGENSAIRAAHAFDSSGGHYGNGLRAPADTGKNFVLDTNVLLHDPDCLNRFRDNHICILLEVLCELDRFKGEQSERGANARSVHRRLAEQFSSHPDLATVGIPTSEGGSVRLVPGQPESAYEKESIREMLSAFRGQENADNRILVSTQLISESNQSQTILVTKDLNLQLKAHAIGMTCEDYQNDKVDSKRVGQSSPVIVDLKPSDLQRFREHIDFGAAAPRQENQP